MKKTNPVKQSKIEEKEVEELALEPMPPESLFEDVPVSIPPMQSPSTFPEVETDGVSLEELELEAAEETFEVEAREEAEVEQEAEEELSPLSS